MSRPTVNLQPPRPRWGVRGDPHKQLSTSQPISTVDAPAILRIPVATRRGNMPEILVKEGTKIAAGAMLADGRGTSASVNAPVEGTVVAIEERLAAVPALEICTCIVLQTSGADPTGFPTRDDPMQMDCSELRAALAAGGIVGLGGALYPTAAKLEGDHKIETLIINGAECEPYISCDDLLLRERSDRVIRGGQILMRAASADACVIAIENDMIEAWHALHDAIESCAEPKPMLAVVTAKYPAGGERQLIEMLVDREVPLFGLPGDIGVLCQNVGTAAAVADLFDLGQPLISRIVTLTGLAVARPGNYEVPIGTPVADLIAAAGGLIDSIDKLIMGGPMMGIELPDDATPVTRATNCIIAAAPGELACPVEQMPCIRCGECAQVCPARLLPQDLIAAVSCRNTEILAEQAVDACIECGCCDYVCPSGIPITAQLFAGKSLLARERFEKRRGEEAMSRQTIHEARVAAEQVARNAELQAQTQAITAGSEHADPVAAAIARARAKRSNRDEL